MRTIKLRIYHCSADEGHVDMIDVKNVMAYPE
jgi:hypothetical protein